MSNNRELVEHSRTCIKHLEDYELNIFLVNETLRRIEITWKYWIPNVKIDSWTFWRTDHEIYWRQNNLTLSQLHMYPSMAHRKEKQRGVINELNYLYPTKASKGYDRLKRES